MLNVSSGYFPDSMMRIAARISRAARPPRADRLGGDDVVLDRHHARLDALLDPVELRVAGEDHDIGRDHATPGDRPLFAVLRHRRDRALFVDARAGLRRCPRQPLREGEGVEMPRAAVALGAATPIDATRATASVTGGWLGLALDTSLASGVYEITLRLTRADGSSYEQTITVVFGR